MEEPALEQPLEWDSPLFRQALMQLDQALPAADIVKKALAIAADLCIYTNTNVVVETLGA